MAFIHANNVYVEYHTNSQHEEEILQLVHELNDKLNTIMADNQKLQDELVALQASVDVMQAQIADLIGQKEAMIASLMDTVAALQATIADLQAQIAAGATPEQLQAAVDQLEVIKADVESTIAPASK